MSIKKRKEGTYRARAKRVVNGEYQYLDKTFKTKKEAQDYETQWLYEIKSGLVLEKGNMKFPDYAQDWLNNLVGVAESTRNGYQYKLNNVYKYLKLPIKEIKNSHIKNVMRRLQQDNYSKTTMQHCFKVIKQVLDQALIDDVILRNPCATFKKTTNLKLEHIEKSKALTKEEQHKLIDALSLFDEENIYEYQLYVFVALALYTGMRRGELACLKWEDIDLKNRIIDVNKSCYWSIAEKRTKIKSTKTKAGTRLIKIDTRLANILSAYEKAHKEFYLKQGITRIHNYCFPCPNGDLQRVSLWSHRVNDNMKRLGIEHTLHNLRHTHASNLLMYNFPLTELSMRLGHADPHVTLRVYSHFIKGMESDIDEYMKQIG